MESEADVSEEVEELGVATAKRGIVYVAGDLASSLLTIVLLIFLARYLQPAEFGIYSIVIAFSTLLSVGSNFGVGTAFRKMLPEMGSGERSRLHSLLSNGYFIALVLGAVLAIAGVAASSYLAVNVYNNSSMTLPLQIASVVEFIAVVYNLTLAALTGLGMVKHATASNVTYGGAGLGFSLVLVLLGYGVVGALLGLAVGTSMAAIVGLYFLITKTGFRAGGIEKKAMKKLGSFSAPVVVSHIAQLGAQNFAVLFLGVFATTVIVGNYGSAYKLARFVEVAITDITFILLPAFATTLSKESIAHRIGSIYNNSIYYSALVLLPVVAYVISAATPITNVLLSSSYAFAPFYVAVMVAGMTLGIIGIYAGTLIIGHGDTKRFMKYQIIAIAIQLILLVALTPYLQANGVLIALFVVTPIALNAIYIVALREQFTFIQSYGKLARITAAAVVTWAVLFGVANVIGADSKWLIITNAIVAFLLFPPLAVLFRGVEKKNIEFVRRTGERLRPARPILDAIARYTYLFLR